MIINLQEIYAGLKAWRNERKITAESQKQGYIINIMEELGELAAALREYEIVNNSLEWAKNEAKCGYQTHKYITMLKVAEHDIIDALCDIAVFTINAGTEIPLYKKCIDLKVGGNYKTNFAMLVERCASFANDTEYSTADYIAEVEAFKNHILFNDILNNCAFLCEKYGFNFEIAMIETIKEINSRTGSYDENAKKWVKDTSAEAILNWYKADYEKARIIK